LSSIQALSIDFTPTGACVDLRYVLAMCFSTSAQMLRDLPVGVTVIDDEEFTTWALGFRAGQQLASGLLVARNLCLSGELLAAARRCSYSAKFCSITRSSSLP